MLALRARIFETNYYTGRLGALLAKGLKFERRGLNTESKGSLSYARPGLTRDSLDGLEEHGGGACRSAEVGTRKWCAGCALVTRKFTHFTLFTLLKKKYISSVLWGEGGACTNILKVHAAATCSPSNFAYLPFLRPRTEMN